MMKEMIRAGYVSSKRLERTEVVVPLQTFVGSSLSGLTRKSGLPKRSRRFTTSGHQILECFASPRRTVHFLFIRPLQRLLIAIGESSGHEQGELNRD